MLLLYSDIQGFTAFAEATEPKAVMDMLRNLYDDFDKRVLGHGLFKVMTIGDAYIIMTPPEEASDAWDSHTAAGGHRAARSLRAMLTMAFEMVETIRVKDIKNRKTGQPLRMRIGVHYGRVTAGVIGTKKFRYDIFGTDALMGNKLESEGEPGGVVISDRVRALMSTITEYEVIERPEDKREVVVLAQSGGPELARTRCFEVRPAAGTTINVAAPSAGAREEPPVGGAMEVAVERLGASSSVVAATSAVGSAIASAVAPARTAPAILVDGPNALSPYGHTAGGATHTIPPTAAAMDGPPLGHNPGKLPATDSAPATELAFVPKPGTAWG